MKYHIFSTAILALMILAACAAPPKEKAEVLTPLPPRYVVIDPDNNILTRDLHAYIKAQKAPAQTRYEFTRVDLNGDGRREGIVMMKSPHNYWCDTNGCFMAVFEAHNNNFTLNSEISPIRGPITVSDKTTDGWRDLIVRISGRFDIDSKDIALSYNGSSYPSRPDQQPSISQSASIQGTRIFP